MVGCLGSDRRRDEDDEWVWVAVFLSVFGLQRVPVIVLVFLIALGVLPSLTTRHATRHDTLIQHTHDTHDTHDTHTTRHTRHTRQKRDTPDGPTAWAKGYLVVGVFFSLTNDMPVHIWAELFPSARPALSAASFWCLRR
jgi:hypothetical protein